MKIKKLKNKYKIEFDNREPIITYDDIILKYNILYKKELSEELIDKILKENTYYDAYYASIAYISQKLRSEYEVKKYLDKFLLFSDEKNNLILKLKELNLINDSILASAFVNDKIKFTNYGPYKIKEELEKIRIDDQIINEALEKIDSNIYYNKIKKIIAKKMKTKIKCSGNVLKQKLIIELNILGFPKDMVYDVLSEFDIKGNIDITYNKIYQKYVKKYTGYNLNKKIEQKLYSLGFSKEEINKKITHN